MINLIRSEDDPEVFVFAGSCAAPVSAFETVGGPVEIRDSDEQLKSSSFIDHMADELAPAGAGYYELGQLSESGDGQAVLPIQYFRLP